ncbi:hypothetical protein Q5W_13960 [Hydrogenophaga sp. PBC]|uniref:hypothetical protein n=1 Tax=Hydrogenophaga sp. PBC TaxID=795665 RepID=UPI000853FC71|nr:hypothetical protein [Hydrogenophaga sp. PBC]AOS79991.1 hypothetical protein Q5W_13960 [Hydrogenophaga sp. PBC]
MWSAESRHLRVALLEDRLVCSLGGAAARETGTDAPAKDEPAWRPAAAALVQQLAQQPGQVGRVSVVLGSAFVRWQLVDWPAQAGSDSELQAFLRLRFRGVYGAASAAWRLAHAVASPGQALPACAVDEALPAALAQAAKGANARLVSVRPYVSSALDHWRGQWRGHAAWGAGVEPGHLTLALLDARGHWLGLGTVRCAEGAAWREALAGLQSRLALQAATPVPREAPLFVAGTGADTAGAPGWRALVPTGRAAPQGLARLAIGI